MTTDALGLGLPPLALAWMLAAYFLGGIVKGGIGFGLPLVTLSLMPLVLPVEVAIAINAVLLPFINVVQIAQSGGVAAPLARFWPLALALMATLPLGVAVGTAIEPEALTLALGVAVVGFTLFQWLNPRLTLPARLERPAGVATGLTAGLVGGLVTINGPIFILYLVGLGVERRALMAALGLFLLTTGLVLTSAFWVAGLIDAPRALAGLACLAPTFAGMALGNAIGRRLPQAAFRNAVLAGLLLLGLNTLARGLLG
jgi:hypothetical protein